MRKLGMLVAVICIPVVMASAGVIPTPGSESLPVLFEQASVVVAAEISAVEPNAGSSSAKSVETDTRVFAVASVQRVYKGSPAPSIKIIYDRPRDPQCFVSRCLHFAAGEYWLLFLMPSEGQYALIDPFFGRFRTSLLRSTSTNLGIAPLEADLEIGLSDPNQQHLLTNIELLGSSGNPVRVSALLNVLTTHTGDAVRSALYVALLRLHSYTKLRDAGLWAQAAAEDRSADANRDQICSLIGEIREPATLPDLAVLARSPSDRLRESAVHALREIGDSSSVPVLVGALDDRVPMIRYDAVFGLASVEKNWNLAPSVDTFLADESKYINAWKSWWSREGNSRYEVPR